MYPRVSVIVPVYGVERYIERCAVSLFKQTYPNIEYVFVNDATKDKSIEILEQVIACYPMRQEDLLIITHQQNKGLSAARNTGLDAISGDYLIHVDSDDYLATDAIEHLVNEAEESNADIVLFDTNVVATNGIRPMVVQYKDKEEYIKNLLQHTASCAHWNKFYRKTLIDRTGIRSDERIRLAEDYAVTPRIVYYARSIAILHENLYFYETTNQTSYVHNLKREAIESQYLADTIETDFFTKVTDAATYADVIAILPQRSMVSLAKNTDKAGWKLIRSVYSERLEADVRKMTLVNRIIFCMLKKEKYSLLTCFMDFYHFIMRFTK